MSTELAKSEQITSVANVNDVVRLGKVFFESGMFEDIKSMAQAIVKVQAGAELGIPPFQAMSGVHIIKGKPSIGAGLMAAMIDKHPEYDFEVQKQDDKLCEIAFFKNGKKKGVSTFTLDMAKNANLLNNPTWKQYPQNMLYARAMSNGARMYCPGVFGGPVYVPEELESVTEDISYEEEKREPVKQSPDHATAAQKELIQKLAKSHVFANDDTVKLVLEKIENNDLQKDRAIRAIEWMEAEIKTRKGIEKSETVASN